MEEKETITVLSRTELRKQKLIEYLSARGKLKEPNSKTYLRDDYLVKKPVTMALKVVAEKENKTSADRSRVQQTKMVSAPAIQSTIHSARRALGVTNCENTKNSTQPRWQHRHQFETSGPAQPKIKPVITRSNTVVPSKFSLKTSDLKKQSNTGIKSLSRVSSNAFCTAVQKSNNRLSCHSNAAWPCPIKTGHTRISLGPLVKTKTGLIPAVTQPRQNPTQNLKQTSTTSNSVPTSSVGNTSFSVTMSKRPARAERRTLPSTANRETKATPETARPDPYKSNSKSVLGKLSLSSCTSQPSSGLKSTSNFSKCTVTPIKGRVGTFKSNKSAGQPTHTSTKQGSAREQEKNSQACKIPFQTSLRPASKSSSRVVSSVVQAAVVEHRGDTKTCPHRDNRKAHDSIRAQPLSIKRTGAPVKSQTVPRPATIISHASKAADPKMTKIPARTIPQTEGKKQTAAQEERMRKLKEWREAKGISYKRPPMPAKPQIRRTAVKSQPFWTNMVEEDGARSLICAVDRSLNDCIKLLREGCPSDQVKAVLTRLPALSHKFAKYWICQARLLEQEGNLDRVLPMFEEAVGVVMEPVDELRTVVFEILKKKDEIQGLQGMLQICQYVPEIGYKTSGANNKEEDQIPAVEGTPENINNPMMTPNPVRALICGEKGNSSVIKYKITATPGGHPSQQKEAARVNGQEVRFFTPVRRSVRIERASLQYPESLQDHDVCVASYNDLITEEDAEESEEQKDCKNKLSAHDTLIYVYRENEALKDKVSVRLVCNDDLA